MPSTYTPVRITDVLDPLTDTRGDIEFDVPGVPRTVDAPVFDGSAWWSLPGVYDADAHLPLLQRGVREQDRSRALTGGVTALNSAVPWQLLEPLDLETVTTALATTVFPRMLPILSVNADETSAGFAAWIDKFGAEVRETWMPVIKVYSNDPHFWPNLEAIWAAGCRAAIYFYDEDAFAAVVASRGGPVHFRHVISQQMYEQVASRPESTCQTSPHFLLELPDERPSELHVLPPVPGDPARSTLRSIVADKIDLIASDHNAPVRGNTGPGLDGEQHLLPALLTLVEQGVLDLATAMAKVTTGAAEVFHPAAEIPASRVLVDPSTSPALLFPGQEARRAPYRDLDLAGTVVAVESAGRGLFL